MYLLITRRRFLAALGGVGIVALTARKSLAPPTLSTVADADPQRLTGAELDTLAAFGRVLIPSSFSSTDAGEAQRADAVIGAIITSRAADPAFRDAVALLDETSTRDHQASFVALDVTRQRQVVSDLFTPYTTRTFRSRPYYSLSNDGRRVQQAWSSVAKTILIGFYESRLGWQVVGYAYRPGECSNLIDYQDPPA